MIVVEIDIASEWTSNMLDLSLSDLSPDEVAELARVCAYQPFKLPRDVITGAGLTFTRPTPKRISTSADSQVERAEFLAASTAQAQMYEEIIEATAGKIGGFIGKTVLDFACNAGYFSLRISQLGAARSVGVDKDDFSTSFAVANNVLGTRAEFRQGMHDQKTHELHGADGEFDVVLNIAYLIHVSDPTYMLAELARRAKRALVILTSVTPESTYQVTYGRMVRKYFGLPFPMCFDSNTQMSIGLLRFALTDLGFREVVEVEPRTKWPLSPPVWRAFVAIR